MTSSPPDDKLLAKAFSIIEDTPDLEVVTHLRDLMNVDHVLYYLPRANAAAYIRFTYPASWISRYLQMDYAHVDPIQREGFQRTLPFNWNELKIQSAAEASFLADALSHGIGPHGFCVPLSKHGHRALFSISSSRTEQEWTKFLATVESAIVQIADRLHRRAVIDILGADERG